MPTTTYGDISQRTAAWAASDMLDHAEPIMVLGKFGQTKPIPKNKAKSAKFRRPVPFAISTTPLVEGVTPSAQQMQYEDVQVDLEQYGGVCEITDVVADVAEDPVMADANEMSGEQAGETKEMLLWGILKAGSNVAYANGTLRTAVNTAIEDNDISGIVRFLKSQRAKFLTEMLAGSTNYATRPIQAGYIAFAHTDCQYDIEKLTGFVPVAEYGSRKPLCPEEVGAVGQLRFILSPLLVPFADAGGAKGAMKSTTGTLADVYPVIVIAKAAYGHCPLKGASSIKPSVINPGTVSKSDPLGQRGYVGWKMWHAASILNQAWMIRLEVAVTDL